VEDVNSALIVADQKGPTLLYLQEFN